MLLPSLRGVGSMTAQTATQNPSFRVGPCDSGDLLIVFAGKRAGSNFTFPAAFTKATETAPTGTTSGMTSAFAWKWGALADSGSTIVVSTSGAGNLFHGVSLALRNVHSVASPINNLISEVYSRNYTLTGSLTALGQALGVCLVAGFDNVAVTQTGFVADSWSLANSHTTTTGSDGYLGSWLRPFVLANSGGQFNPSSGAGTAPRHMYTFQVLGAGELLTPTLTDETVVLEDSFLRGAMLFLKIASDALEALDTWGVVKAWALLTNEGFTLSDAFIKDVVSPGAGQVYPVSLSDPTELTDALTRHLQRRRTADDGLTADDAGAFYRRVAVEASSVLNMADALVRYRVLSRMGSDAFAPTDVTFGARYLAALLSDPLLVDDGYVKAVVGGGAVFVNTRTDATDITDQLLRTWQAVRMLGDVITAEDERRLHTNLMRVVQDTFAADDAALRQALRNRLLVDIAETQDGFTRTLAQRRLADDFLTLSDALTWHRQLRREPTDTVSVADAFITQGSSSKVLSDSALIEDGALAVARRNRLAGDVATILDELRFSRVHGRVAADVLTADDKRSFLLFLDRADTINVLDARTSTRLLVRALSDALSAGDGVIAAAAGVRVRTTTDTITLDDGYQRVTILKRVTDDAILLGDAHVALTAGLKVRTLTDPLLVDDAQVSGAVRNRRMQDLIDALYDQAVSGTVRWRVLSSALSPADFVIKLLARVALLSDDLTLDSQGLRAALRVRSLYDVLEVTDAFTKSVADALANLLDVHILIGAALYAPSLGQHSITRIGAAVPPVLGGYN